MNDQQMPAKSGMKNINGKNLWRLETFGDLESAEIQVYHPVLEDGSPDASRATKFCSLLDIRYRGANMKHRFEIPAATLQEAVAGFLNAAEEAGYKLLEELEDQRRRAMLASGGTMDGGRLQS